MKTFFISTAFWIFVSLALCLPAQADSNLFKQALEWDRQDFLEDAVKGWEKFLAAPDADDNLKTFAQIKLSIAYFKLGEQPQALESAQKPAESQPGDFNANFNLGNLLGGSWKFKEAVSAYEKTTQIRPDEGLGYVALALCLFGSQEPDKAVARLREVKKIFKKQKNITWHQNTRYMIQQIRNFAKYPPDFSNLWLSNNLKNVRETYDKTLLKQFEESLTY